MGLREKLEEIRTQAASRIPEEGKEVMRRATRQLAESGQVERVLGPGAKLPSFALKDCDEIVHSSAEMVSRAPLVLQFFRGHW